MAEKMEFPDGEPEEFGNDWPAFLEKGTEVHGIITGFGDYRPTETYTSKKGAPYLKANLVFRIIDNEGLSGYHVRDGIQIPTDGEKFMGSRQVRDILFHKLKPFGILLTEFPIPTTEVDMVNMVMGQEEWAESGGMIGKMVTMVAGQPSKAYESKKDGSIKGPFSTFGYFKEIDPNVMELLKEDFEAWTAGEKVEKEIADAIASGGMDDEGEDLPF